tara:strand:+ start:1228 stop:1665 length:438 start_codon:yes stop_codon:yes gene_type:complete
MISDFNKIVISTVFLNFGLIYLAYSQNLNAFDSLFIYSSIGIQLVFLNALFKKKKEVIHYLHFIMMMYIILGIGVSNKYLLILVILLLVYIQILWIIKGECILSQFETSVNNGFGKRLAVLSLLYTVILSFKLCTHFKEEKLLYI